MKIRFFCDVPEVCPPGWKHDYLFASPTLKNYLPEKNIVRIAFDVEMPASVLQTVLVLDASTVMNVGVIE